MEIQSLKINQEISDIKEQLNGLLDLFYPVGSYYETSNTSFNPNTSWGGTWVEESDGTVLVSECGGSSAGTARPVIKVGDKGGEYWHKLTVNEIPSHNHNLTERFMMWDAGATYAVINQYQWKRRYSI